MIKTVILFIVFILTSCVTIQEDLNQKCVNILTECGKRCIVFEDNSPEFNRCIEICNEKFEICKEQSTRK